jgi:hypothetical protein
VPGVTIVTAFEIVDEARKFVVAHNSRLPVRSLNWPPLILAPHPGRRRSHPFLEMIDSRVSVSMQK